MAQKTTLVMGIAVWVLASTVGERATAEVVGEQMERLKKFTDGESAPRGR